jgi:transcriptional regulator with XRE-family HTH domain
MTYARLTPTALQKRTGISRETVYAIKKGERLPSIDVLERLANEMGTTAGRMLEGGLPDPKPTPPKNPDVATSRLERLEVGAVAAAKIHEQVARNKSALLLLLRYEGLPETLRDQMRGLLEPSQEGHS